MRYRWWIATTLLLICLFASAVIFLIEPSKQAAKLSDGNIVRLESFGLGPISYDSYPRPKAALAACLPISLQSRLGERTKTTLTHQPDEVNLLFSFWTADGKHKLDPSEMWMKTNKIIPGLQRAEFVESTGFVFKGDMCSRGYCRYLSSFGTRLYPRRDPMLHVRIYEQFTDRLVSDFRVPNPGFQTKFPEWSPQSLPTSQTVSPLTVTLKHGPADFNGDFPQDEDLDITSTDSQWIPWQLRRQFWMSDATGNQIESMSGLSPFEPAWKLHVRIWRDVEADFETGNVWRTDLFPVPGDLTAERLDLTNIVGEMEFNVVTLSAAGTMNNNDKSLMISPHPITGVGGGFVRDTAMIGFTYLRIDSRLPYFLLMHPDLNPDTELIVSVRDQNGTKLVTESFALFMADTPRMLRVYQFEPTAESTQVQLEVIVNRGRTFEFLMAPPKPTRTME